jgi:two-component system CheB/CheR fusion protein
MGSTNALPRGRADVPPAAPPLLDGLRVLVVDDEARIREMLREMLGCCGAAVTAVASVSEALRMMPEVRPDVLLSDLSMPERDGYALIRAVRALAPERGGRVPAVAVSGDTDGGTRQRAQTAGFDQYLAKPVDLQRLVATIGEMTTKGVMW